MTHTKKGSREKYSKMPELLVDEAIRDLPAKKGRNVFEHFLDSLCGRPFSWAEERNLRSD